MSDEAKTARRWLKAAAAACLLSLSGVMDVSKFDLFGIAISNEWKSPHWINMIFSIWLFAAIFKMHTHLRMSYVLGTFDKALRLEGKSYLVDLILGGREAITVNVSPHSSSTEATFSTQNDRGTVASRSDLMAEEWDLHWAQADEKGNSFPVGTLQKNTHNCHVRNSSVIKTRWQKKIYSLKSWINALTVNPEFFDNTTTYLASIALLCAMVTKSLLSLL